MKYYKGIEDYQGGSWGMYCLRWYVIIKYFVYRLLIVVQKNI